MITSLPYISYPFFSNKEEIKGHLCEQVYLPIEAKKFILNVRIIFQWPKSKQSL